MYAITLKWPSSGGLDLGEPIPTRDTEVTLLGLGTRISWEPLEFDNQRDGMFLRIPALTISELPCQWAWVFKLNNIE